MAHVKINIPLPTGNLDREAIADAIIETIVERTRNRGRNKDGRKFPGYSKAYRESLDYKIAGKTGKVDLTLSGDMLAALAALEISRRKLVIGYEADTEENDKAEGNIKGTYGDENRKPKPRNFLGISNKDLARIIAEHSELTQMAAYNFVQANYDNTQSERI